MSRMTLSIAAAVGVLVAGCGDDDSPSSAPSGVPEVTTAEPDDRGVDPARAEQAVLRPSDFPAGWSEDPDEPESDEGEEIERSLAECAGYEYRKPDAQASFHMGEQPAPGAPPGTPRPPGAFSVAGVVGSDETLMAELARIKERYVECYEASLEAQLEGVEFDLTVEPLSTLPAVGDGMAAFRTTLDRGLEAPTYTDIVFIHVDRVSILLIFLQDEEPFPADLAGQLVSQVTDRARSDGP